jgi:hypothetical protein
LQIKWSTGYYSKSNKFQSNKVKNSARTWDIKLEKKVKRVVIEIIVTFIATPAEKCNKA